MVIPESGKAETSISSLLDFEVNKQCHRDTELRLKGGGRRWGVVGSIKDESDGKSKTAVDAKVTSGHSPPSGPARQAE